MTQTLEIPGFTMKEASSILGLSERGTYRLAYEGKLRTYRDVTGRLRIQYGEMYKLMNEREERNE